MTDAYSKNIGLYKQGVHFVMRIIARTYMLILLAAMLTHVAAAVNFTVSVDRTTVLRGDRVAVIATLTAPKTVSGVPQVAASNAFVVQNVNTGHSQSRNIQVVNGRVEHSAAHTYRYVYTIASQTDSAFTFPALTVNIDGVDYTTRPLHFNSGGGAAYSGSTATPSGSGSSAGMGGRSEPVAPVQRSPDIRASLTMSKRTLYPGEQAILTLKIMQKASASIQTQRGYMSALEQIENAFGSAFSLNRLFTNQVTQGQERVDGELYHTFTLQYAVFGLTAGEYSIPAITFEYDEMQRAERRRSANPFFSDFFDMDFFGGGMQAIRRTTRTAPFTVTVRPLPSAAPAGFSGSVGRMTVSASVSPDTVQAGEAVTLRVTVRGNTRASNIGNPVLPDFPNSDIFPPERQTVVDTGAGGFTTRMTHRYLIIPKDAGTLTIDPITYPFFDPESGTYRIAQTAPMTVTVTPGRGGTREQTRYLTQEEILQVGHDIRYIKMPPRIRHQEERPYRAPHWYLLFPLPFLYFLFVLLYKMQTGRSSESRFKSIRQKALGTAVKELNKAGKSGTDNEFLGKVVTVIEKYISHKLAFPATGRTLEELKDELLSRKIDEQTVTGLAVLIESVNEYRFGGKQFDTQSRDKFTDQTIKFLSSMEKIVKKEKPANTSSAALLLIAAMYIFPFAASAENIGSELQEIIEFAGQDFANAKMALPTPASASNRDVNVWFQIANNFYKENLFDSALVYYAKIIDAGTRNSSVYFNMGNCYYRLMKPGMARLHYEKAAVLSPNDADIQANINFIKSIIVDRAIDSHDDAEFLTAITYNIHTMLPLETQLIILCALLFILSLLCSAILLKKGLLRLWLAYGAVLCAILTAVIGISAGYKIYALETRQYAIIMTPSLDAKNQPAGTQTLFTAHEGTKLRITKTVGDWSLVSLPNGASGWVTTSSLGRI